MNRLAIKNFLKKISHFNVVLVPTNSSISTKNYKISPLSVLIIIVSYSLVIFFAGFYLITFLNLSSIFLPADYIASKNKEEIRHLNEKILFLAQEIENLQISNKKLKNIFEKQDSLNQWLNKSDSINKKIQNNILYILKNLIYNFLVNEDQEIIFRKPTDGVLSNKFNPAEGHFGIDYSAKENTPIYASANGYVSFAGFTPEYGNEINIVHQSGFITKYKHCSVLLKKNGDVVKQGELIALVGNTGLKSHGFHLHFEIWLKGKPVNPENFLLSF